MPLPGWHATPVLLRQVDDRCRERGRLLDLAVSVEDVDAEHARLTALGLAPRKLVDFAPGGEVIARFFFVADPDGYQIEVLQRRGRYL